MQKFTGKGIYKAVAIGNISVFESREITVKRSQVANTQAETERFEAAKAAAISQLTEIYKKATAEVGESNAEVFEIHMMMLEDEDYNDAVTEMIETECVNAEYAVAAASKRFADMFSSMDDGYMSARAADVKDISNRLIGCLTSNCCDEPFPSEKTIICADDLAPSETVSMDKNNILAFATAEGSVNSHTAILARSMNIPAIIGLGFEFLSSVKNGVLAIADGFTGEFILEPDEATLVKYRIKQREQDEKRRLLQELSGKENVTLDGTAVNIFANIGSVDSVSEALLNDAGGIGLFRSEFLYLQKSDYPSEEEQLNVYKKVLESMNGKKVIIRTLDIGADKQTDYFKLQREENPALGLRAIRLCLERPEMFKTQLRALFKASVYGNLGIMFPMVISEREVREILRICDEVKAELKAENFRYSDVEIGIMIETPAAAIISDRLAPLVDFFSIGTNDLTQYTLACDRQNTRVERFCDSHHEAVLRLIELTVKNAHLGGAWVGICGELASDTSLTEVFLRMGVDELSVAPPFVLELRDAVRNIDLRKSDTNITHENIQ